MKGREKKTKVQVEGQTLTSKGFTLIELLAVIVILAIIELIAIPIILNIVNDSKEESNQRSVEMYAKAVENAVATYQLENNGEITGSFTTTDGKKLTQVDTTLIVEYEGDVVCETIEIYEDGKFYLAKCKVNKSEKEYTYGTKQGTQVYYSWTTDGGNIGGYKPDDAKQNLSELDRRGYPFYLKLDVDGNNVVKAAYVCFEFYLGTDCLKGAVPVEYEANKNLLESVSGCYYVPYSENRTDCHIDDIGAHATDNGYVSAEYDENECAINADGSFKCGYMY